MVNQLNQVPSSLEPISTFGSASVPTVVKPEWYKFFVSVSSVLQNLIGGVLGFTSNNAVTAAGAAQGTATVLAAEWSVITVGAINTGVLLRAFGQGTMSTVFNQSGTTKKIYPPTGGQIDALGPNAAYSLGNAKQQTFSQISPTQWLSTILGP